MIVRPVRKKIDLEEVLLFFNHTKNRVRLELRLQLERVKSDKLAMRRTSQHKAALCIYANPPSLRSRSQTHMEHAQTQACHRTEVCPRFRQDLLSATPSPQQLGKSRRNHVGREPRSPFPLPSTLSQKPGSTILMPLSFHSVSFAVGNKGPVRKTPPPEQPLPLSTLLLE